MLHDEWERLGSTIEGRSIVIAGLLALGSIAGALREVIFAIFFGTSRDLDIFRIAFSLPNTVGHSLGPVVVSALVPGFLAVRSSRGGAGDSRFGTLVFLGSLVAAFVFLLVGVLGADLIAQLLAPGFGVAARNELVAVLPWLFTYGSILIAALGLRAGLNAREVFWPSASASLAVSVTIVVIVIAVAGFGAGHPGLKTLVTGTVAGGILVGVIHGWRWLREYDIGISHVTDLWIEFKRAMVMSGVAVFAHATLVAPRFIDRAVASGLMEGAVAAVDYGFAAVTLPGVVFGTAVVTVFYPRFVEWYRQGTRKLAEVGGHAAVTGVLLAGIAGLIIWFYCEPLVTLVLGRGQFDASSIELTVSILRWHGLGVSFMVASIYGLHALIGTNATSALVLIGILRVAVKLAITAPLARGFGVAGLGISFAAVECGTALSMGIVLYLTLRAQASRV